MITFLGMVVGSIVAYLVVLALVAIVRGDIKL